ncbi:MAG TPA: ClpXP protease specificity-enhancing factor SspB [Thermoanaerobaculia bacterium]|nr:ClpXP protease specificity-enhancing factor SspB [Thermoanaerobaculia bacterium]
MDTERINYPKIIQDALRGVVRRVLEQVAEHGLPGEHHFLIAFRTEDPGVRVPQFLRDLYPDEIKIMLQHQFWDLVVDEEAFSVTLSFNAARQSLFVPFSAVTAFVDPSVELMLRFESPGQAPARPVPVPDPEVEAQLSEEGEGALAHSAEVLRFDPSRRK